MRIIASLTTVLALAGCAALPESGPSSGAVHQGAAVTVVPGPSAATVKYVEVPLSPAVVAIAGQPRLTSFGGLPRGGQGRGATIGIGDVLSITVFEADTGGLFIPKDAGTRAGNFVTIPDQQVDSSGWIAVPFAGRIMAAGRAPSSIQAEIEEKLKGRAIEPQVVVTLKDQRSQVVSVLGEVTLPITYPLFRSSDRVLDAIARGGGPKGPGYDTYVTLSRGGRSSTIDFDSLVSNPANNVYVQAGDTVYVSQEPRSFLAFGATGKNGRFNFGSTKVTFAEGVGKAEGLLDARADPGATFVFRNESIDTLRKLGVDVTKWPGPTVPVVYSANLRNPADFFLASQLYLRDKDIIFVSNAATVDVTKTLGIVTPVIQSAYQTKLLAGVNVNN